MFGFGNRRAGQYQTRLADFATSCQGGVFKRLEENRQTIMPLENAETSLPIIGAMTNWIFRFGDYGRKGNSEPAIRAVVDRSLAVARNILLDEDDKVELTYAIIVAAAAQEIPIDVFMRHFDTLYSLGLVMIRINIRGAEETLRKEHKLYYYYMQYGNLSEQERLEGEEALARSTKQ